MDALTGAAARGRDALDAAVRALAPGRRSGPGLVRRPRQRVPRLAAGPDRGQRLPRLRAVPAERAAAAASRGRCRCSRSRTGGSSRSTRSSTRSGCSRSSGCRRGSTRRTSVSPKRASSSASSGEGWRSHIRHPSRRAVSWRRASASIVPASGRVSAATSQTSSSAPERSSSRRARSHSAAASAGVSAPLSTSPFTPRAGIAGRALGSGGRDRKGISTCRRVPSPGGLSIATRPSSAPTRSTRPRSPEPPSTDAPPHPSSVTSIISRPHAMRTPTAARPAPACLTTLASASETAK